MVVIMKRLCFYFIILASFTTLFSVADARRFNVGGNGVWDINPQENYNTWAERNRFQVNDTLYFKYVKGSDSVLQVMKSDYDGCDIKNPIKRFDDGESVLTFDRSGPFYFVSGDLDRCKKGQKLIVVVLAVRNPVKPPSTANSPKSPSPVSPVAPVKPPTTIQPPNPSPVSPVAPANPPSYTPANSPMIPSPSPKSSSPASSPLPSSPSSDQTQVSPGPEKTPATSPSPSETTPSSDSITSPGPSSKNSASGVAVTSVMTTVISLAFTVLMFA